LAPILVLALWGAAYLVDCLNAIVAPGTPLVMRFEGRSGLVTLRAESYAYDYWSGGIVGRNVTVTSPNEIPVARAESLTLRLPDAFGGPRPSIDVSIRKLEATVERDADGKLSLMDLLPEPTDEPSEQPFKVDIEGVRILLIDRSNGEVWANRISIPKLAVDGVGENWRASGLVEQEAGGTVQLLVRGEPKSGVIIEGKADRFELARYLGPLQRTPELRDVAGLNEISAEFVEADGPFWAEIVPDQPAKFSANIAASGRGLRYQQHRVRTAQFEGLVDSTGATGWIEVDEAGVRGQITGRIGWQEEIQGFGQLKLSVNDPAHIPLEFRRQLPPELSFRGANFDGVARYMPRGEFTLHGSVNAAAISWETETFEAVSFDSQWDGRTIALRNVRARYEGNPIQGAADIGVRERTLQAFAQTGRVQLEDFRERTGLDRVSGFATAEAHATGSLDDLRIEVRLQGEATGEFEEGRWVSLGPFHALAVYQNETLNIDRLAIAGPTGVATANGSYGIRTGRIDLEVLTTGIDLADLHSKLSGTAIGRFEVSGTAEDYLAEGPVEVFGLKIAEQDVPLLTAQVQLTPRTLAARDLRASRGAGRLRGEALWAFESGALSGSFSGESFQIRDFTEENVEGSFDVRDGIVSGTIDAPVAEASVSGADLVAMGLRVDTAEGRVKVSLPTVELSAGIARFDQGEFLASGTYDWESGQGLLAGQTKNLPLDRLQPLLPPQTIIEGQLEGAYRVVLAENKLAQASVDGMVQGLTVNRAFFGSGPFMANGDGPLWTGQAQVGQPERYIEIDSFSFRPETRQLEAQVVAYELPVRDMFLTARPYLAGDPQASGVDPPVSRELVQTLDGLEGTMELSARISGSLDDPEIDVESLLLKDTKLNGDETGRIDSTALRSQGKWTVRKFRWTEGPGILDVTGTFEEEGKIALDGNLNNFDTQWLAQFAPSLSKLSGDASLFFSVTGETKSPQIEASLSGSFFEVGAGREDPDKQLKVEIYPILVSEGEISAAGTFAYRGFKGTIEAKSPFRYPATIPDNEAMSARLKVEPRPIKELRELIPTLDPENTEGTFTAQLDAAGPKGAIEVTGNVQVEASALAITGIDTQLKNVKAVAGLAAEKVSLSFHAEPIQGGTFDANLSADLMHIEEALSSSFDQLLTNSVSGTAFFKGFRVDERHGDQGSVAATANGALRLTGSLGRPVISTFVPISLESVRGVVPSVFESGFGEAEGMIRPEFRVAYIVGTRERPAEVVADPSQLTMYGSGTLTGRLPAMKADATLRVATGSIRLPNARIRLTPGGTVRAIYDASLAEPDFRLDVDIEGRTSLSTLRFTNLVERYEVFLDIRGNLLDPEEQLITARSDPPDLTSERILSLLGQIELFQSLSGQFTGDASRSALEQTLAGLALPVVFDPVTEALARQFGLEYLSVNYGPLGQTDVTLAKFLGKGFTLQGRREISDPIDGVVDYDLRLTYRAPRHIRSLRDLVFSLGTDQDRPWKISVEYGKRFRNGGSTHPSNLIRIGPEPPPKSP